MGDWPNGWMMETRGVWRLSALLYMPTGVLRVMRTELLLPAKICLARCPAASLLDTEHKMTPSRWPPFISLSQRRPVIITAATEGRCQWAENCLQGWLQQCDKMQPSLWSNYNAVQKQCSDSFLLWVNKNSTRLRKGKMRFVCKILQQNWYQVMWIIGFEERNINLFTF